VAKTVDEYLGAHRDWAHVLEPLSALLRDSGLEETVKWGSPVYVADGVNVVGLGAFKAYAGLWFFHGGLMDDPDQVLVNAQQGKTRGMRQWRFQQDDPIDLKQVQAYVDRAIANARAGKVIKPRAKAAIEIPAELDQALRQDQALAAAFDALTAGRRREYAEFIAGAKMPATRDKRMAKIVPMIAAGHGLNDRYKK
jgi:uncharacterized protein YdeI (YjbR/CyaY-like superfamily)